MLNPSTRNTAYMSFDGRNHQALAEGDRYFSAQGLTYDLVEEPIIFYKGLYY